MTFLEPDDHILIMDFDINQLSAMHGPTIPSDDCKRLRDAGIKTAIKYVQWHLIEPAEKEFQWDILDSEVNKWLDADVKVLLSTYQTVPQWFPENWYAKNKYGVILRSSISAFNMEAQQYANAFIKKVVTRYPNDHVCAFNAQLTNGETIYHNEAAYYDDCAKRDYIYTYGSMDTQFDNPESQNIDAWLMRTYINMLLKQQEVFVKTPHKDLWTALHPAIRTWTHLKCNGNKYAHEIFTRYRINFPDSIIHQILYTFFPHGNGIMQMAVDDAKAVGGMRIFAGSEYVEGLQTNLDTMRRYGLSGFVTAPIHPFTKHTSIEKWMLEIIKNTNDALSS